MPDGKDITNLAIIQARTGATRLPNKVLMKIEDLTILEHVVLRVKRSRLIDEVVVATTSNLKDLEIVKLCANNGIRVFCGSENDVLDRYYQVAKLFNPQNVIRITADCPLIDPKIIDFVIQKHIEGDFDYTSNTLEETFPDGLDVEVMKFNVLCDAWQKAKLASQREHVTQYIINNDLYIKKSIESDVFLGDKRWTLDTIEDYEFINNIFKGIYHTNTCFGMNDVINYVNTNKNLESINHSIERNEGLRKSLENDYLVK